MKYCSSEWLFRAHSVFCLYDIKGCNHFTYDANGNILAMTQKGLKINTSPVIDSLLYGYAANSNQLLYVTDKANDTTAHLGDFTEINNNTTQDYWYDGNGNYTKDNNKGISAVTYNFMNLPQQVTVTNKGTISYVYDAAGNKLQKKITEGARIVTTTYISGYVYQNDTLQYTLTGEGRVRYLPSFGGAGGGPVYDYFIKDHLGNVRMVLTDEKDTAFYPAATFEDANIATEQLFFDNADVQRTARPGAFYTSSTNGNKVQLLRKSVQSKGAGQLLKVMSGDKLHIKVDYYIPSQTTDNNTANGLNTIISALASVIDNNPVTGSLHGSGSAITGNLNTSTPFTSFMSPQTGTAGTSLPKAYLNIVFFDEQFKFVSENSEAVQVTTEGSGQTIYRLGANAKEAAKNGYVYIYVSNESNNLVYFDNLQITHEKGPLLEESHYYPFGTEMKGISSRSLPSYIPNRYKANAGAEYGDEEWTNGSGLEMYETFYRSYNAQIGRFMQGDPVMEATVTMSGYVFSGNNPVMFTDLLGDQMKYMDSRGNVWHHRDPFEGTALAGIQYVEGWGSDGFGDKWNNGLGGGDRNKGMFGDGPYAEFWEDLWNNTPADRPTTYGDPNSFDFLRPYTYANLTGVYNTNTYHDDVYDDPQIGQTFVLTAFKGVDLEASWYEWDGPVFRTITPDFINVGVGFTGIAGIGAGTSIEFNWVLHGPEASWKPALTATQSIGGGYSVDATVNVGTARYSGKASFIRREMIVTNTLGNGNYPTIWASGSVSALGQIGITGMVTPLNDNGVIYGAQLNFGAGLPAGPIPLNAAAGISNTWLLYDFMKKSN